MFNFLYDSLETVQKLKFPTRKEITDFTIAVFVMILVASLYIALADTVISNIFRTIYQAFRG